MHSIKLVGHPGPVTRLLSCTKARGLQACPVPQCLIVVAGPAGAYAAVGCRVAAVPPTACRGAPSDIHLQESWEALDAADRELAATLPIATHWAPSYSIHPRTGDRECLCWAGFAGARDAAVTIVMPVPPPPVCPTPILPQTDYPGINKPVAVADWLANTEVCSWRCMACWLHVPLFCMATAP